MSVQDDLKASAEGLRRVTTSKAQPTKRLLFVPVKVPSQWPTLASEEQTALEQITKHYKEELRLPESDGYAKTETRWVLDDPQCLVRFLRATDWNLEKSKDRLKETLEWRREYKPDLIKPSEIEPEVQGGKITINGFDAEGRPILYLRPAKENTKPSERQIRNVVFQLERLCEIMPKGVSKCAILIDYKGSSSSTQPPMWITKRVINILQQHYPERLGAAVILNLPWYLSSSIKMITPILDKETTDKLSFNPSKEKLRLLVPRDQLDATFGGNLHYTYDPKVYFPALCQFCGVEEDGSRSKPPAFLRKQAESEEDAETAQVVQATQPDSRASVGMPDRQATDSTAVSHSPRAGKSKDSGEGKHRHHWQAVLLSIILCGTSPGHTGQDAGAMTPSKRSLDEHKGASVPGSPRVSADEKTPAEVKKLRARAKERRVVLTPFDKLQRLLRHHSINETSPDQRLTAEEAKALDDDVRDQAPIKQLNPETLEALPKNTPSFESLEEQQPLGDAEQQPASWSTVVGEAATQAYEQLMGQVAIVDFGTQKSTDDSLAVPADQLRRGTKYHMETPAEEPLGFTLGNPPSSVSAH
ncbi:uncharacterized protein L969DRAFT_88063 [Mixia osmundae IAM 14324]|uniref:CRAL-TRIO domain-containing protein n=1 Tax=Mixia osmundae (strain CBS 9802 / IAM 14324 / JCM 22182 / KY 12970) TaxID=764103 RepID=G7E177_MIXOS|nr:uncharacterized protein L969DRAFT_88063 [Mixia osmundae IAM 14324]KEI38774.1 hypothetical protein L969DRAFT_88063 [Mixia osmundae IAM 14324]GAA96587.1 hypothetical protein E5Q_03257 [Mixia osmundae IAM 14324]